MEYASTLTKYTNVLAHEGGSDIHFSVDSHPTMRINGQLAPLLKEPILTKEDTEGFLAVLANEAQRTRFATEQELDFAYEAEGGNRFRCNAYYQRGAVSIAMRLIPGGVRTLSELNLPQALEDFARMQQGFFLVVGPVGQGKTTTLAAMLELINAERPEHIITIEDPIEYSFESKRSIIEQREVGIDSQSFSTALRAAFREDMDVIMIGEMRDADTMGAAVTAAETGHLVFSTLHTNNASQTIDRIIDTFPGEQQKQIRLQLAASLAGIFSQRLIPRISGGLVPAYELLINNKAVGNLIREGRTQEVDVVIETSSQDGMIDMNRSLATLVKNGEITVESAYAHSLTPQVLDRLL